MTSILSQEPLRWTITTPLYNIGEQAYFLSEDYKKNYNRKQPKKFRGHILCLALIGFQ